MANQLSFWIGQVLINDRFETSETFSISFELDRVSPIVNHNVDAVFLCSDTLFLLLLFLLFLPISLPFLLLLSLSLLFITPDCKPFLPYTMKKQRISADGASVGVSRD